MWHNMRNCDCLQGPAATQGRPGPLGRRVSQVCSGSGFLRSDVCRHGMLSEQRRDVTQCEDL